MIACMKKPACSAALFVLPIAFSLALLAMATPALAVQQDEVPLLAIVVGFESDAAGQDTPYDNGYDWGNELFFGEDSLAAYCSDLSQGGFSIVPAHETSAFGGSGQMENTNRADRANDGVVHVTLDGEFHDWSFVNEDEAVAQDFEQTVLEVLNAAGAFSNIDEYDVNGDGALGPDELLLIVIIPGYDASALDSPTKQELPLLWPHQGAIDIQAAAQTGWKGPVPSNYLAIPERSLQEGDDLSEASQEPVGILAHELGHCLGLPDLYALNSNAENCAWSDYEVGGLSLMSTGAWARTLDESRGWIYCPSALDPWSLVELGWCTADTVENSGEYHLFSRDSDEGYNILLVPTSDPNQYYLLENRQPEGHDTALKDAYADSSSDGGIVIWHVDKGICDRYSEADKVNDTDHRPGVMPLFFEVDETGAYASDWARGTPNLAEPFFNTLSVAQNLGNDSTPIELPLYGNDGEEDTPASRASSGITVQIMSEPGQDMVVRIQLANDIEEASSSTSWTSFALLIVPFVSLCVIGIAIFAVRRTR